MLAANQYRSEPTPLSDWIFRKNGLYMLRMVSARTIIRTIDTPAP